MQERDRSPAGAGRAARIDRVGRRRVLGGLAGLVAAAVAPAPPVARAADANADASARGAADRWRGRIEALAGRYRGDGFEQAIGAERGGFAIRQIDPPDMVEQRVWPSMLYRRVGSANYFSGLPADRLITEHEVWWARFEADWLTVEARFYDRYGKRMSLLSQRRLGDGPDRLIWRVRLLRIDRPVFDRSVAMERV
ncbi:MAG: hypothetical protein NXI21_18165 [Alphaproteobacteria bacterium]|nr:hypothetical protein [Alphaproteobacteria bacterium]